MELSLKMLPKALGIAAYNAFGINPVMLSTGVLTQVLTQPKGIPFGPTSNLE